MEKKRNTFFHKELAPSHMPKRVKKQANKSIKFKEDTKRVKLNREMIIRQSLRKAFLEYMTNCSLSGIRFLVDGTKSIIERIMLCVIIGCSIFCFFYFVNNALETQKTQPSYMTLEDAAYPINNILFPAIAICNHNRIKKSAVERLVDILYSFENTTFPNKTQLFEVVALYGHLYDFSYHKSSSVMRFNEYLEKIENIVDGTVNIRAENISDLLLSLTPSCEDTLVKCSWKGNIYNCSTLFRTHITQFGFCCTFNYYNTEAGRLEEDPQDPIDNSFRLENNESGPHFGLTVAVNAQTHEYLYTTRQSYGFDVLFFDRYDYADQTAGGLVHRLVSVGSQYDMGINPLTYYSTPDIKRFSFNKRGCKFADELHGEYHGHYSLSNCLLRCRMRTIERLCHCVPFFLPRRSNVSACTLEQLYCLNKYSQKLLFVFPPVDLPGLEIERENSLTCPKCMPDCSATKYHVISNKLLHVEHSTTAFTGNLDLKDSNLSIIRMFYIRSKLPRYRVDVTFHWFELISYLGGLCGFFTGYSMMSLAEFFYFLFIRFSYILAENWRRTQTVRVTQKQN